MNDKSLKEEFHKIVKDVIKYYELKWEYFKLEFVESLALLYTKVFSIFLMWLLIPVFLLFVLIALALYLGSLWGKLYLGFLAVGGGILIIALIILLFRKVLITNPLVDALVSAMFDLDSHKELKITKDAKQSENKNTK